jgi:hypothetical protein
MPAASVPIYQAIRKAGIGMVIPNADWTVAAGSATSVKWFRNGNWGTNHFRSKNALLWRPGAATAADYVRYASDLTASTGALAVDANWADTTQGTEDLIVLYHGIHPQYIIDASNLALAKAYFTNSESVSTKPNGTGLSDASFQKTATSHYTASSATLTKVATANSENVIPGSIGSGRVVTSGAGGYIYQDFAATADEQFVVYSLSRLDSGTAFESVLESGATTASLSALGTTVEHAQEAWQWTKRTETIPDGHKVLRVRWQGEGNGDDFYLGAQNVLFPNRSRIIIDTVWESNFEALKLMYADIGGVSVASGVYQGNTEQFKDVPKEDYEIVFDRAGANPGYIQFKNGSHREWQRYPLFIWGRRPYSDLTTVLISDLTTTSTIDTDLWDAMLRIELFSMGDVRRQVPDVNELLARAHADMPDAARQFPAVSPSDDRRWGDHGTRGI